MQFPKAKEKAKASKAVVTIAENLDIHQETVRRNRIKHQIKLKEAKIKEKERRDQKAKGRDILARAGRAE